MQETQPAGWSYKNFKTPCGPDSFLPPLLLSLSFLLSQTPSRPPLNLKKRHVCISPAIMAQTRCLHKFVSIIWDTRHYNFAFSWWVECYKQLTLTPTIVSQYFCVSVSQKQSGLNNNSLLFESTAYTAADQCDIRQRDRCWSACCTFPKLFVRQGTLLKFHKSVSCSVPSEILSSLYTKGNMFGQYEYNCMFNMSTEICKKASWKLG